MRSILLLALCPLLAAAAPPVAFVPVAPRLAPAAEEYRRIWREDGARIVAALEQASGLPYPAEAFEAIVGDGPPMAALDGRTIRLKGSYPPEYKRATLVHEIGHRLAFTLPGAPGLDDHRLLYLFLYDAWTDLYGRAFADRMVAIERRIPGGYDYAAAWDWALAMTRGQRRARLAALAAGRERPRLAIAGLDELMPAPPAPVRTPLPETP